MNHEMIALLDQWDISEDINNVHEMFELFKICVESYSDKHGLDTKTTIRIIKDLRSGVIEGVAPECMYYFTDVICDNILQEFVGMNNDSLPSLLNFITECEQRAYANH